MNAGARLALYGAGLAATFAVAYVAADIVVPDEFVTSWMGGQVEQDAEPGGAGGH